MAERKKPSSKKSASGTPGSAPAKRSAFSSDEVSSRIKAAAKHIAETPASMRLVQALELEGIRNPLVIVGPQHLRVKRLAAFARDTLLPQSSKQSLAAYFGPEISTAKGAEKVVESLESASLFSSAQIIVIYDADAIKAAPGEPILEALKKGSSQTLLILTAASLEGKSTFIADAAALGTAVRMEMLEGQALKRWIEKEAVRAGAKGGIAPDAAELLARCYGEDLSSLAQEIAKLSLLTVGDTPIRRTLIEQVSLRMPEFTTFQLIGEIARKNVVGSVMLANEIVEQGMHPLQVASFLSRCVRTMLAHKDAGPQFRESFGTDLGNAWIWRNLSSSANMFSLAELKNCVAVLGDLDWRLKSSGFQPPFTLSLAVQQMASRSFAGNLA